MLQPAVLLAAFPRITPASNNFSNPMEESAIPQPLIRVVLKSLPDFNYLATSFSLKSFHKP